MKQGDPQETSEQPSNAPQPSEDTPSSTSTTPASTSSSETTKPADPSASPKQPHAPSTGPGSKLRSSGIFKTANLSGVYNLNSLPTSSFSSLNPPTSSASITTNSTSTSITTSTSNGNNNNNANGSSTSDDHSRVRRQNGVASSTSSSDAHDTNSSSHKPSASSSNINNINNTNNNNNNNNNITTTSTNSTNNSASSSSTATTTSPTPAGASSPLYTTLSADNASPHLKSSTGALSPSVDKDLLCPICLEVMNEAFISRCGHSFCYLCIVKHLQIKQNCPCCSVYLTRDQVFPNFIFNKIVEKTKTQPSNPLLSSSTVIHMKHLQTSILGDSGISISDIDTIMQTLLDKKKLLEAEDQSIEMEVLLDFLNSTKRRKMEALQALQRELTFLDCDIERVSKLKDNVSPAGEHLSDARRKKRTIDEVGKTESQDGDVAESPRYGKESLENQKKREAIAAKKLRVEEHLEDLQSCYFESCKKHDADDKRDSDADATRIDRYNSPSLSRFTLNMNRFTKYSNFKVLGTLRYGDIFNQSSIVSSIEFDRDDEFFATAGVTKKIKIFDYNAIIRDTIDMHYPVSEMSCKSKISCLSWNAYIKSQIASSDYEGIVSLWDATTGQIFSQLEEHEKRVWSVDFSKCDPTQLASGSDDTKVKIWSTSTNRSVATIESKANICCVKWNPTSPYLLAFGSADHHIHYFDLRAAKEPLFVFRGHKKAVSYVKFMSKDEIVSASTDSTLKLWKNGQSECVRTFAGHTNEKNFVGLAVNGDYVCCGSENNGVYAYYKMMSKPIVGYKFGSSNPVTGEEMEDDASQFVSSVCWRKESNVLLAANSQGTIKILELV